MRVEDKSSSAQLAKEDAAKADAKRNVSKTAPFSKQMLQQNQAKKNSFDALLDSNLGKKEETLNQAGGNQQFVERLKQHEGREDGRKDNQQKEESEHRDNIKNSDDKKDTPGGISIKKDKILAKRNLGERGSHSGGDQHHQHLAEKKESSVFKVKKRLDQTVNAPVPMSVKMTSAPAIKTNQADGSKRIPQAIIQELVQYISVQVAKGMKSELEIAFKNDFFKGLRLKLKSHNGQIMVQFSSDDAEVVRLFDKEKDKLTQTLAEKNIQVSQIVVNYTG